ncbi:MAG: type II secretion system F family protein [Alphaproteobacteria bacterium]|nr:type II secretion system F family protein [Alphaproteobacteria bacterium]
MSQNLIIFLGLLVVAVILGMMAALIMNNRKDQQKRVMAIIAGKSGVAGDESAGDIRDRRRADMARKLQEQGIGKKSKKTQELRAKLFQAGWGDVPLRKFYIISAVLAVVFALATKLAGQSIPVVLFMAVVGGIGFPRWVLKMKIGRRQKKFLEDFPDALDAMVRLLKAGMPVGEAILMVSREFTGPIGEEMSKVYDEQKIGIPMAEACLHMAERIPLTEVQMFATGIAIQQQTGSSLSEILTNLSRVLRARFRLRRKVAALSAEAKASAMIIGALPIIVAGGLYAINPKYMEPLFFTSQGKYYLTGAICWMSIGILVMRQMINFKI